MGAPRTVPPFNTQDQTRSDTYGQSFTQTIKTGQSGGKTTGRE